MLVTRISAQQSSLVAPLFDQYRVFYGQPSDLSLALTFVSERLNHNQSVILLAQDEKGKAIGFTQLYPSFSSVSAQKTWILNDLFVIEECRGKGIGKALLNGAKDHARTTGAKGIALETAHDNHNAQALYESLGYEKDTHYLSYFLTL